MSLRASAHRNRRCHCEPVRRLVRNPPDIPKNYRRSAKTSSTQGSRRYSRTSAFFGGSRNVSGIATPVLRHWFAMTYFYRGWFIIAAPREALIKSARAGSERFCSQARFEKRWSTVCISRFSNRRLRAKDPLSSRRRFIQSFPKTAPFDN